MAASLHALAALPNSSMFEFCMSDSPLRHTLTHEHFTINDAGFVTIPDKPGLGVTVNEDTISRYRVA